MTTGMDLSGTERWIVHAIPSGALVQIGRVAETLGIALPAVSRACSRLVDAGHLVRLPDPRDRRRILVGLSDQADEALRRWAARWPVGYLDAAGDWPAEGVRALDEWFRIVTSHVLYGSVAGTSRTSGDSVSAPHLRQLRSTVEIMVPAAGRLDLMNSFPNATTVPLTDASFQTLLLIARSPGLLQSEIAAQTDTDPALNRRRILLLTDLGLVRRRPSERRSEPPSAYTTSAGSRTVDDVLASLVDAMPEVPNHLLAAGLPGLMSSYVARLTAGPESSDRSSEAAS
jgi:DNA-binding MarR family transcriptional regulator